MLTIAQYAARRGVSRQAVQKALRDGRITAERSGRRFLIDPVPADREWERNTDPFVGGKPWAEREAERLLTDTITPRTPAEHAIVDLIRELLVTRIETDPTGQESIEASLILPLATLDATAGQDQDMTRRRLRLLIAGTARAHIDVDRIRAGDGQA